MPIMNRGGFRAGGLASDFPFWRTLRALMTGWNVSWQTWAGRQEGI